MTEPNFYIAECFNRDNNKCVLVPRCSLRSILNEAKQAFLATPDRYTIADTINHPEELATLRGSDIKRQ